jgi:hypothetical protein
MQFFFKQQPYKLDAVLLQATALKPGAVLLQATALYN